MENLKYIFNKIIQVVIIELTLSSGKVIRPQYELLFRFFMFATSKTRPLFYQAT